MIEVEDLSFTYPGSTAPTLDQLSFSIGKGEVYGLLGPSGAGKSTTQRILMGLLPGFSGAALVFGKKVGVLGRAYYERIGVSFELPTLYLRLTARENLKLFAALYDRPTRDPMEVLSLVDLAEAALAPEAGDAMPDPPEYDKRHENHNPYLDQLLGLFSQSPLSNAGTRGLDEFRRWLYVETRIDRDKCRPPRRFSLVRIRMKSGFDAK
jgi:energy-coupling factor transporter ATP-binding protein EcfA2